MYVLQVNQQNAEIMNLCYIEVITQTTHAERIPASLL